MGRRRRESPAEGFLSDVFELCSIGPIWVGPLIAALLFGIFFFLIPWFLADRVGNDLAAQVSKLPYGIFRNLSRGMAPLFSANILRVCGLEIVHEVCAQAQECFKHWIVPFHY